MAKGKKGKDRKKEKPTAEDDAPAPPPEIKAEPTSKPLATPEEIRISFNIIRRLIDEIEKCTSNKEGITIFSRDVDRAEALCLGLLEQNKSIAIDPEIDYYHPQFSALKQISRAKRQITDAVLTADEVTAVEQIFAKFPRNIVLDFRNAGRGQKEPYLRLMTTHEGKGRFRPQDPVLPTLGHFDLMFRNDLERQPAELQERWESMKKSKRHLDLDRFILRFTPTAKELTETSSGHNINVGMDGTKEKSFFRKGDPLQKPVVDKEANMTAADWHREAEVHQATLERESNIRSAFWDAAAEFIPIPNGRHEPSDLFGIVLEGIERLAKENTTLVEQTKDLRLSLKSKTKDTVDILQFVKSALPFFPKLQEKCKEISGGRVDDQLSLILEGIRDMRRERDNAIKANTQATAPLLKEITEKNKKLAADAQALQFLQDSRTEDHTKYERERAKESGQKAILEKKVRNQGAELDQRQKALEKHRRESAAALNESEAKLFKKTEALSILTMDYEACRADLEQTREHSKKLESGRDEWEVENKSLRKQVEEVNSSLRSTRTNQQVEQDRIRKAVQGATAGRDERIKRLENELRDRKRSDTKVMQELSQDKYALKEKNQELEEKLSAAAAVTASLEQELAEERNKSSKRLKNAFL